MRVILGNNVVENCDAALVVNDTEVFRLRERQKDGRLVCDFDVRDKDGARIATIAKNNVVFAANDCQVHQLPRDSYVQDKEGSFVARVQEIDDATIRITGEFWIDGYQVLISNTSLVAGGNMLSGSTISGFGKAISLAPNSLVIGTRK